MGYRYAKTPAVSIVILLCLLLPSLSSMGAVAQPSEPSTSSGQVIAHGIDALAGASLSWRVEVLTALPGATAAFGDVDTGFAIGDQDPVIATDRDTGRSAWLEGGNALFHPGGTTLRLASATGSDASLHAITLTADNASAGAMFQGTPFQAPAGTHTIELMRDVMAGGDSAAFDTANAFPYLVFVTDGSLQVTDESGAVTDLGAGSAMEVTGSSILDTAIGDGATWLIASIGPEVVVPPLPVAPGAETAVGSLVIDMMDCPEGTDPLTDASACRPATLIEDISLSPQGDDDPAKVRTLEEDATEIGTGSYRFTDLPAGTWVVQPSEPWYGMSQGIEITGDIVPLGGIWGAVVNAGEESRITLYRIGVKELGDEGALTVQLFECPPRTDPNIDASMCLPQFAHDWDILLAPPAGMDDIIDLITAKQHATDLGYGGYTWDNLTTGTWRISAIALIEDVDVETYMFGDAYPQDGGWAVDIVVQDVAMVDIYLVLPEGHTDTGDLLIELFDCPPGTDPFAQLSECYFAEIAPNLQISLVSDGEPAVLTTQGNATYLGPGMFVFEDIPTGLYLLEFEPTGIWTIENVVALGNAYMDQGSWWVWVTIDGAFVDYYHIPPALDLPEEPTE
jgi:hypothetical protein